MTIAEAAVEALKKIGCPSTIREIYKFITEENLYSFNTDFPEHVLQTEIRRKTLGVERIDSSENVIFEMVGSEKYQLRPTETRRRASIGNKRIHRAKDKEILLEQLTDSKTGVFREIWRALLFAASLGYAHKTRVLLSAVETGKGIDQGTFANHPVWPGISYLFAMVETDSTRGLAASEDDEDLRIKIFEEYANGGLQILKEEAQGKDLTLETLLTIVDDLRKKTNSHIKAPSLDIGI